MTAIDNIIGRRVRLIYTDDKYTKLKSGALGTITGYTTNDYFGDVTTHVQWDDGSTLSLLSNADVFELLSERDAFVEQMNKFIVEGVKMADMWSQMTPAFEDELNSFSWPFSMSFDEVMCELIEIREKITDKVNA